MKYLSFLIIALSFSSCCSAKQIEEHTAIKAPKIVSESSSEVLPKNLNTISIEESINEPNKESDSHSEVIDVETNDVGEVNNYEKFNHSKWDALLKSYVSEQGNVDYKGFKSKHELISNYITELSNNMPQESWSKNEKLAFWINAYNVMTVDLIIRNYPLKSIKDIDKPWEQRLWKLQDKWYNLDEIEHQILRKMNEPRIHFAIVCASISCPKLQNEAFVAERLEDQLTRATRAFLADTNENSISKNSVKLSKLFKWFAKDFKEDGTLIDFLNTYTDISISQNAKKSYKEYNWNLND